MGLVQEFVNQYGTVAKVTADLTALKCFEVSGSLNQGLKLDRVSVYSEEAPAPKTVSELNSGPRSYKDGDIFVTEFYAKLEPKICKVWTENKKQCFKVRIDIDETWKPGLYCVSVWAKSPKYFHAILVSSQTAILR